MGNLMSERRQTITEYFSDFDPHYLNGLTLKQCAEHFNNLDRNLPDKFLTMFVRGYGYDGGIEMILCESRLETDKEFQDRLAAQYEENEKKLMRVNNAEYKERQMYEKLKAKFGDA